MKNIGPIVLLILFIFMPSNTSGQVERTQYYTPGEQEKELLIIVHIWGEVNNPGKFVVRDGTTLVDLISEAGGPTKFALLKRVIITHAGESNPHVELFDMKRYIEKQNMAVPVLVPGDVVVIKRNGWGLGLDLGQMTGQLAVILNTIWLVLSISNII